MFHEPDIVLENLPLVILHLPEYINHEADVGRREKAQGLFDALSHPLFKSTAAFFCDGFPVVSDQGGTGCRRQGFDEPDVHTIVAHRASCHSRGVGGIIGC